MGNPAPAARARYSKADPKSRHRYSGSVSSITITSEDFTPSNVDVNSPVSSVSSSSSFSLKDKRPKRRTRSSLGGTEDFLKELDITTPSLNKKTGECANPLVRSQLTGSASGQAPRQNGSSVKASSVCAEQDIAQEPSTDSRTSDATTHERSDLTFSRGDECDAVDGSVSSGGASGVAHTDSGMRSVPGYSGSGAGGVSKGVQEHRHAANGMLTTGVSKLQNGATEVAQRDIPDAVVGDSEFCEASAEDLPNLDCTSPDVSTTSTTSTTRNGFEHLKDQASSTAPGIAGKSSDSESPATTSNGNHFSEDAVDKAKQAEEKVSVQKRIEQLERIARAKAFHLRSQSLSLPRPYEISPARHHEAEGSKGRRMPLYEPPRDSKSGSGRNRSDKSDSDKEKSGDGLRSSVGGVTARAGALVKLVGQKIVAQMSRSSEDSASQQTAESHSKGESILTASTVSTTSTSSTPREISTGDSIPAERMEVPSVDPAEQAGTRVDPGKVSGVKSSGGSLEGEVPSTFNKDALQSRKSGEITSHTNLQSRKSGEITSHTNLQSRKSGEITSHTNLQSRKSGEITNHTISKPPKSGELTSNMMPMLRKSGEMMKPTNSMDQARQGGMENASIPEANGSNESEVQGLSGLTKEQLPTETSDVNKGLDRVKAGAVHDTAVLEASCATTAAEVDEKKSSHQPESEEKKVDPVAATARQEQNLPEETNTTSVPSGTEEPRTVPEAPSQETGPGSGSCPDDETLVLLAKQPAVDPLFVDAQQDRLWEMHSQELTLREGETSGSEVRESSAQDEDAGQLANETPSHTEASVSGATPNGTSQSDKSGKIDRPRTPLRSLLAEEEAAERGPGEFSRRTTPQNQISSPRGNLFKQIVSGSSKGSPTKQPSSSSSTSQFTSKSPPAAKPFFSSCICCSVK